MRIGEGKDDEFDDIDDEYTPLFKALEPCQFAPGVR